MHLNERRLTGRDVLAKTFQAKTKRGYDPVEVDAYLELVAAQIDVLHGDLNRRPGDAPTETTTLDNPSVSEERDRLAAELNALRIERDELVASREDLHTVVGQLQNNQSSLQAENAQLRTQLTSIAPPPPIAAEATPAAAPAPETVEIVDAAAVESDAHTRGSEESYELVLRMAHRSAEETISEAHARADEIVADANLTAAQIARESDRKAYEAANKVQAELASLAAEVETKQGELAHLRSRTDGQRNELREMAQRILRIADGEERRYEGAEVVDLRTAPSETPA